MEIKTVGNAGIDATDGTISEGGIQIRTAGWDGPDAGGMEDQLKKSLDPQTRQMYAQLPRAAQKRVMKVYEREMAKLPLSAMDGTARTPGTESVRTTGRESGSFEIPSANDSYSAGTAPQNGRGTAKVSYQRAAYTALDGSTKSEGSNRDSADNAEQIAEKINGRESWDNHRNNHSIVIPEASNDSGRTHWKKGSDAVRMQDDTRKAAMPGMETDANAAVTPQMVESAEPGAIAENIVAANFIRNAGMQASKFSAGMAQAYGDVSAAGSGGYAGEAGENQADNAQNTIRQGVDVESQAVRAVSDEARKLAGNIRSWTDGKRSMEADASLKSEPKSVESVPDLLSSEVASFESRAAAGLDGSSTGVVKAAGMEAGKKASEAISAETEAVKESAQIAAQAAAETVKNSVEAGGAVSNVIASDAAESMGKAAELAIKSGEPVSQAGKKAAEIAVRTTVKTDGITAGIAADATAKAGGTATRTAAETVVGTNARTGGNAIQTAADITAKTGGTAARTASGVTAKAGERTARTAAKSAGTVAKAATETTVKAVEAGSSTAAAAATGGVSLAAETAAGAVEMPAKMAEKVRAEIMRQYVAAEISLEAGSRLQEAPAGESAGSGRKEEKKGGFTLLLGVVLIIFLVVPLTIFPVFLSVITGNSVEYAQEASGQMEEYGNALAEAAEYELSRGGFGGLEYITWYNSYGYEISGNWCGMFISYCGYQCGYVGDGVSGSMPFLASCTRMQEWYEAKGWYFDADDGYIPSAGDIIFYETGHAGIVYSYDETTQIVRTIDGNVSRSDSEAGGVTIKTASYRNINSTGIAGYACPALSVLE